MFRTVLVGYRPDGHGDDAVALARLLAAARLVGRVVIVEIADKEPAPKADRRMADLTAAWREPGGIEARVVVGESVAEALHEVAEAEHVDMLILGATHRGFAGRMLRGTTEDHVARESHWPIVVAPDGFRKTSHAFATVGVAFDGSGASQAALEWAAGFASAASSKLRLIAVAEPPPPPTETWAGSVPAETWADGLSVMDGGMVVDAVRQRKEREIEAARASVGVAGTETVTIVGDVVHELRGAAEDLDMLVLGSSRRGRFEDVMLGSASRGLATSCPAPLALVPELVSETPRGARPG